MKIKFNQNFLNKLIKTDQKKRFLLIYPYLKGYVFPLLHSNRFKEISKFDWDDLCSQAYCDIFILCDNNDWLDYHYYQVKRFLFIVVSNSMLRHLGILYKSKNKLESIDDYENVLFDESKEVSIFDVIEIDGMIVERQLIRIYERMLGRLNNECRTIIERYSRIIVERNINK